MMTSGGATNGDQINHQPQLAKSLLKLRPSVVVTLSPVRRNMIR